MSGSPTAIHRTGPLPLASDYSKTLLQALTDDELCIGPVSRVQLLLTTMVERVHDAIYVLPRHARDQANGNESSAGTVPPDPEEYARDIYTAIKGLEKYTQSLPDDQVDCNLDDLNRRIVELRNQNQFMLDKARQISKELPS